VNAVKTAAPRAFGTATRAPLVMVTGGKGGVGKTTIALNLALELARAKKRVLLVDLDLGLANVHVLLRLSSRFTIEDALSGRATLEECVVRHESGLDVLAASSGTVDMARLDEAQRATLSSGLRALASRYDVVLGDSAAGIGRDVLAFCGLADHVLLVTTPDPAALTDAYGLIKALHAYGEANAREVPTPELVVNRASGIEEAVATASRLRQICERFLSRSPRSAGWMPASGAIELAARFQRPLALHERKSLAVACLEELTLRIARLVPIPESVSSSSCSR
jgi:flagellar biosynthesis protein FlhG